MTAKSLVISTLFFTAAAFYFGDRLFAPLEITRREPMTDEGRNEGSTPRSFILPATPAVALIQEAKIARNEHATMIKSCLLALMDAGFYVRDLDDIHDDQIPISLIRFQIRESIPRTGILDNATRKLLEC